MYTFLVPMALLMTMGSDCADNFLVLGDAPPVPLIKSLQLLCLEKIVDAGVDCRKAPAYLQKAIAMYVADSYALLRSELLEEERPAYDQAKLQRALYLRSQLEFDAIACDTRCLGWAVNNNITPKCACESGAVCCGLMAPMPLISLCITSGFIGAPQGCGAFSLFAVDILFSSILSALCTIPAMAPFDYRMRTRWEPSINGYLYERLLPEYQPLQVIMDIPDRGYSMGASVGDEVQLQRVVVEMSDEDSSSYSSEETFDEEHFLL